MKFSRSAIIFSSVLFLVVASTPLFAQKKCGGAEIANGPFSYTANGVTSATFAGPGGDSVSTGFTVSAPNASGSTVVFPGEGQNPCLGRADATIGVMEIRQVADMDGNPVSNNLVPGSALYNQIADAFSVSPSTSTFTPGSSVAVGVVVSNPNLASIYYGEYDVKLAAQAPGAGIGVGSGMDFDLTLSPASVTCTTPPAVTITAPANNSNLILGPVGITIQANGICLPLTSLTATISSGGNTSTGDLAVSGVVIELFDSGNNPLPADLPTAEGVTVTGMGSYTPAGGSGAAGTTLATAFTNSSPSGIGTYIITATATDAAGNTAQATGTFKVNYGLSFTRQFVPGGCSSTKTKSCNAQMAFTATRADGAFIFDETVEAELLSGNAPTATHLYGTGGINSDVQINSTTLTPYWQYETHFDGGSLTYGVYNIEALFLDVDGNLIQQGSTGVTF